MAKLIPTGDEADRSAARKDFFSEEKKQKTFTHWYTRCGNANLLVSKVFWFFFSKKNCFLPGASRSTVPRQEESSFTRVGIIPTGDEADRSPARKDFFSEERKQKTFTYWYARCGNANLLVSKVFWFFFFKKELLSSWREPQRGAQAGRVILYTGWYNTLISKVFWLSISKNTCLSGLAVNRCQGQARRGAGSLPVPAPVPAPVLVVATRFAPRQLAAMLIARTRAERGAALAELRSAHGGIALVPTMGALHGGHLALLDIARATGHAAAASIFVNPAQFGPGEDFHRYPRQESEDLAALERAGCAFVWLPHAAEMYAAGDATLIDVGGPSLGWEGDARPGHFRGVATVVAKLFGQLQPHTAVFGEKDWQQLQVIRRMVADLALPVHILGAPIIREPDGLAMSSRNRFLTATERQAAPSLHAALCDLRAALHTGVPVPQATAAARAILNAGAFDVEYLAVVDGTSLAELHALAAGARIIVAARLGSVRLLDNIDLAI